jgi:DNA-binding SARP family transcriptional activator
VLGDFAVDGLEPQAPGSKQARLARHLLALAGGQAVPASVLTGALWGDAPPARPGGQLAVLVSRLRSVLGPGRIDHSDAGYLLAADWLDAAELAVLTAEVERRQATRWVRRPPRRSPCR